MAGDGEKNNRVERTVPLTLGSLRLIEGIGGNGELDEDVRDAVLEELRRHFRPEFLNRIDETVIFKPLRKDEIVKIIELAVRDIQRRLDERHRGLVISDGAKLLIADEAYSPVYGARPVKRYLQKNIETEIARLLVRGELTDGSRVNVTATDGRIFIGAG